MRWERNKKRIYPVIDEKISEIIMNEDCIWCIELIKFKKSNCEV